MFGHPVAVKSRINTEFSTNTGHKGQERVNTKKAQQGRKPEVTFEYQNPGAFSVSEVASTILLDSTQLLRFILHVVLGVG